MGFPHFADFPFRQVLLHPDFAVDNVEVQRAIVYKAIFFPTDRNHLVAVVFFIGNEFVATGTDLALQILQPSYGLQQFHHRQPVSKHLLPIVRLRLGNGRLRIK